jgi:adenylate cyclase
VHRRLAAVTFVDIVGYAYLMANDETRTHQRWMKILSELISPQAEKFHGAVVKSTGDGVLVEFPSAHDAVDWAQQVQQHVISKQVENADESATIALRIAVHLGDVMTTEFDVFGAGVNVAARLQQHCVPGGVILSEVVYDLVRGAVGRHARDLGFLQLKNLDKPIRAYSLDPEADDSLDPEPHKREGPRRHRPSVAVLPFANLSGDAQQDYLSDGVTEDIITELSRFSELLVIARNSTFQYKGKAVDIRQVGRELGARYVLEGSVRRGGDHVRVTAQLIDAVTGAHLWAERYDREVHDVFAVQDEVARTIVAILAAHVNRAEIERAMLKPPAAWEAYECYLRGAEALILHQNRRTKASLYEARRLLEQSLASDPSYARAAAVLSWAHLNAYLEPFDGDHLNPAALDRALELAETAVHLDTLLPDARAQLGYVLLFKRQHDAAMAEFERAIALNPNFIDYRYARALLFAGEPTRAIDVLEANKRLDPFQPLMYSTSWMGQANYMLERYADAVRLLCAFTSRRPNIQLPHLWLAAAYAQLDQHEEARKEAAEVLRINPRFTIEGWKRLAVFKNPKDADHNINGLRKAGLPET